MNTATAAAYVEPVVKTIRVKATPKRAFEVFTADATRWWNKSHSINATKSPIEKVVLEPRVGGRWYEIGEDGSQCEWGKVLAWEPPGRVLLQWQISTDWKFDENLHTEVEVTFVQDGNETVVTLEHRFLERWGAKALENRAAVASEGGWGGILKGYAALVDAG
jgi:uncharacterized protein YndB with AHSA1/START domain